MTPLPISPSSGNATPIRLSLAAAQEMAKRSLASAGSVVSVLPENDVHEVIAPSVPTSLQSRANALAYSTVVSGHRVTAAGLSAEDVFAVGRAAATALDKSTIAPRRKAAFAVADFHKDMLRLKADLEALGKPDEDGKNYTLSQPKAIAMMLILLRKWESREITTVSGKEMTFQQWQELLVHVKERHVGANQDPVLLLDVDAVLAQIVSKFAPESLSPDGGLTLLHSISNRSRETAVGRSGSTTADKEAAWLQEILTSNDKKFLERAAVDFGFSEKKHHPQEAKIAASQWNAIVNRLDAEVSPWQNRLNATMQKAQHDLGTLNAFWTKIGEIIRTLHNDGRGVSHN